jgi:hypothetical protein
VRSASGDEGRNYLWAKVQSAIRLQCCIGPAKRLLPLPYLLYLLVIYYGSTSDSIHRYKKKGMMNGKGLKGTGFEEFEGILTAFRKEKENKKTGGISGIVHVCKNVTNIQITRLRTK